MWNSGNIFRNEAIYTGSPLIWCRDSGNDFRFPNIASYNGRLVSSLTQYEAHIKLCPAGTTIYKPHFELFYERLDTKTSFFVYSVVSTVIWVDSDSKQGFYLSFYTYLTLPPPLQDSIIGLFPGKRCRIESFLAETTIYEPHFELSPEETTRNKVTSLLDKSRFHYLCLDATLGWRPQDHYPQIESKINLVHMLWLIKFLFILFFNKKMVFNFMGRFNFKSYMDSLI